MNCRYIFVIAALLGVLQIVFAGPCETISQTGTRLELVDFGIAYSEDFKFSSKDDRLELYSGACIKRESEDIWQLEADSIVIENASVELELLAKEVSFQFDGWLLTAETLVSGKEIFQFDTVKITKADMQVSGTSLKLDLTTDQFLLTEASALYRNEFQISGQTMDIRDDEVVFSDAYVTTCICEEDNLYDLRSPTIVFDSQSKTLTLSDANLAIGNSSFPLGENYEISDKVDLQFPTPFLDYSDDLELALKNIVLAAGITFDVGAQGVDAEHDFNPYGLLKLRLNEATTPGLGGTLSGVLGKATSGLQADLSYKTPIADSLSLDIGTRNHDWAAAEYLHDVFAGLSYRVVPFNNVLETGTLEVVSRVFAALTSQEINTESVLGPRLGLSVTNNYAVGTPRQGLVRFSVVPEATYYPSVGDFQYAVSFIPSLLVSSDGFILNTNYTHKITNSTSPFTSDADKAAEVRTMNLSIGFNETSPEGHTFGLSTNTIVDFLQNTEANQSPIRKIALNVSSTIIGQEESQLEFKPYLNAELARLVTGIEDASLDDAYSEDFLQFGMDSFFDDWEVGLRARFNPVVQEDETFVEVLEMGLGLPLRQGEFLLKPYVGINLVGFLGDDYEFDVSTYGLSASYECCGDAGAFFQVRDGNLSTGLTFPF